MPVPFNQESKLNEDQESKLKEDEESKLKEDEESKLKEDQESKLKEDKENKLNGNQKSTLRVDVKVFLPEIVEMTEEDLEDNEGDVLRETTNNDQSLELTKCAGRM